MADRTALADRTHAEPRRDPTERAWRRAHAGHGVTRGATERGPSPLTGSLHFRIATNSGTAMRWNQYLIRAADCLRQLIEHR